MQNISKEIEAIAQPTKGRVLVVYHAYDFIIWILIHLLCRFDWRLDITQKVFPLLELMKADVIKQLLSSDGNAFEFYSDFMDLV